MKDHADEHEAFAASRSSEHVYVPIDDRNFTTLDKHAETIEMDAKLPLVLVGEPGIGKNALLSNWVKRRAVTKHRDEFLFQYFAGASTRAKQLPHMLHKLETALKDFFQLREMEVPSSEERLIWSLNRFLAAAAKKYYPARIVIVIDGVFAIKGMEMPAGALHWLPTELPAGVRFIVSTIATTDKGGTQKSHRTYLELLRRNCPVLTMEAMNGECQEAIIGAFMHMHPNEIRLTKEQIKRIINLEVQSKPMYLRTLLYALRQGVALDSGERTAPTGGVDDGSNASSTGDAITSPESAAGKVPDRLLDLYLSSQDSISLTSKVLDVYAAYVDDGEMGTNIMGAVLSVLYASRNGLMDCEVWGAAEINLGYELSQDHKRVLLLVLKDNTMLVQGQRSFSHEEFRGVVYSKYIQSPETMVRLHIQMARYFARLPASDRKVECQPYHLEAAGCWNKLKNCLVDIDMFGIWWTPKHKKEFVALWASLTNANNQHAHAKKLVTSEFSKTMECKQSPRPCYDMVEEYNRSLDEYKDKVHPSDERIAAVILEIADFMLEFSTLGHEEAADIPQFVHPRIPNEDLGSLGVPFLSVDEDGRSVLNKPLLRETKEDDKPAGVDQPPKSNEDFPDCTTYFYHRWMWIQFPWVALANCGQKFLDGIALKDQSDVVGGGRMTRQVTKKPKKGANKTMPGVLSDTSSVSQAGGAGGRKGGGADKSSDPGGRAGESGGEPNSPSTLPGIASQLSPGRSRAVRKRRPLKRNPSKAGSADEDGNYWTKMMDVIRGEIQEYRSELDALTMKRTQMERKLKQVTDEANQMSELAGAKQKGEDKVAHLLRREEKVTKAHGHARLLAKNYKCLLLMCERHPAHSKALVDELELKLDQDARLVKEVGERVREECCEKQACQTDFAAMKKAIQERAALQQEMLQNRHRQHETLQRSNAASTLRLSQLNFSMSTEDGASTKRQKAQAMLGQLREDNGAGGGEGGGTEGWEEAWALIRASTGIADPDLFIQKHLNCDHLETQLMELKQVSESRLSDLKKEISQLEEELEQTRYDSLSIGGNKEARDLHMRLGEAQERLKRSKERSDAVENLQRHTVSGLRHICDLLGASESEDDAHVAEMVHQLEFILDSLVDEKDRSTQKRGDAASGRPEGTRTGHASTNSTSDGSSQLSLEISVSRPAEIEAALQQFVSPKVRVAQQLVGPRGKSEGGTGSAAGFADIDSLEEEDTTGAFVPNREAVKAKSAKTFRAEQRRQARLQKTTLLC
eukprot:g16143.t1